MKNLYLLIVFLLIFFGCEKNEDDTGHNETDGIELDSYIVQNYTDDAKQLYLHEIYNNSNHPNYNNSDIDNSEVKEILKIIQAVYDLEIPERDTIFGFYKIHGYYCYGLNSVYLKVDTSLPEIQNLANNIFPTGEASLDGLLNTYDFDSTDTFLGYPDSMPWLTIFTPNEYNMIPVVKDFANLESVLLADFNRGCVGDGDTITLTRSPDSAIIIFSIGRGDCPSGCLYRKYWEFKVKSGKAEFIKTYEAGFGL